MRIIGLSILVAALGAGAALASSIQAVEPLAGAAPSIATLGDTAAIDPSIVAATPAEAYGTPSIVVLADTPDAPSIVSLGEPAASPTAASEHPAMPTVIRGGEVGEVYARPAPAAAQPVTEPLLDPNDRGTPAKRKALKRQAQRLAEEAAAAAKNPQPDQSDTAAPAGQ
jgi:hypothetical protein